MSSGKIRVVKDYDKLSEDIQEQIKLTYPDGFASNLITYTNKEGLLVSALPFETEEKYYLVRMTQKQARTIIEDDEDYDDDGFLKESSREEYEDKHSDKDFDTDDDDDM